MAAGPLESADPGLPGLLGVWGGGEGFQFLGISKSKGWIKLKARGGGGW